MSFSPYKINWRDTGMIVRLGPLDGRVVFALLLAIYVISWTTFFIALGVIVGLLVLERYGYTLPNAFRKMSVFLMGNNRPAISRRRRGRSDR